MLLIQCVVAGKVVHEMMAEEQGYQLAHALVILAKRLQPHLQFYAQEERKLIEEYGEHDAEGNLKLNEDGTSVPLADKSKAQQFKVRHDELGLVEVTWESPLLKAPAPTRIKPEFLVALDGFLEFEEV